VTSDSPTSHTGFLDDPDTLILTVVSDVEPDLDQAAVTAAIGQAATTRGQRRRLAQALRDDPDLLTSGHPGGPPQVERLIRALLGAGARHVAQPLCGHCHQPKPLTQRDGKIRICSNCDTLRRGAAEPCSRCGTARQLASRDRDGQPLCGDCLPYQDHDPLDDLAAAVGAVVSNLDRPQLAELIRKAVPQQFQRHQVLWELQDRPALLSGQGAHGSPRVNALIRALIAAGAHEVVAPNCPSCGRTVALTHQREGMRCCRRCYDQATSTPCSRCQRRKPTAARTSTGAPICTNCYRTDPANHGPCAECGRVAQVYRHGDDRPLCRRCFRAPTATCSICGKNKPCMFAASDQPRCESCTRRIRKAPCATCGKTLPVWSRTADGQSLCNNCAVRREPCRDCGRTRKVVGRDPEGQPLCPACYRKDPVSFRACTGCGSVERLHHHGLCPRCACDQQLLALLGVDGELAPHLQPVFRVLAGSAPTTVLRWLQLSTARTVLAEAARAGQPLTHAVLDGYPPHQAIDHLRKVLVVGKVLPERDEYLAGFERWIRTALARVSDTAERRIMHRFAVWYQLRRLRARAERGNLTVGQVERARAGVRAAVHLITWLRGQDTTLATCSQRDIDRWLEAGRSTNFHARPFVLWACRNGHAHDIEIPDHSAQRGPSTRIKDDQRWTLVRRLLHDDALLLEDRVAALLLLLYGQPLSRVTRLTRDQVTTTSGHVQLILGSKPVEVPPPLDELLLRLAANRRGFAALAHTDDHPWLFPGGAPALPLTAHRLMERVKQLGIQARPARNTAMLDLAAQLPGVVLSKLLGIHINTATRWTDQAGAPRAAYAAEVARREADSGQ
jgi:hypothetical protein